MVYTVWLCSLVLSIPKNSVWGVFSFILVNTVLAVSLCGRNEDCITIQGIWGRCEVVSVFSFLGHISCGLRLPPPRSASSTVPQSEHIHNLFAVFAFVGVPFR